VEILWTTGAYPVQEATRKFFFRDLALKILAPGLWTRFRAAFRLIAARRSIQFGPLPTNFTGATHP
jgi:hypothetical protein